MVSPAQMAIALTSVALMVLLFVVFSEEEESSTAEPAGERMQRSDERSLGDSSVEPPPSPSPREDSTAPLIQVADGKPMDRVADLRFEQDEQVRFVVDSDLADQVHVHGYDISARVGPGRPAEFSFPATIAGVFEIELEKSGTPVAELTVEP